VLEAVKSATFEFLTAVAGCILVEIYRRSGGTCCLHLRLWFYSDGQASVDVYSEDGDTTFLQSLGNLC